MVARRGPSGSGDGAKRAVSTPEPGITAMRCRSMPSPATNAPSSRVLGQAGGAPAVQRPAKRHAHERAQQPRPQIAGREHVTQPCQRADDCRNAGEPRRSAAVEHRLHRDGMDDVRPLGPIDAPRARQACAGPPAARFVPASWGWAAPAFLRRGSHRHGSQPGRQRRRRSRRPAPPARSASGGRRRSRRRPRQKAISTGPSPARASSGSVIEGR